MSFYCVFFSFLGIDVPLVIFLCIQRRLPFPSFPFSRTVCLVSSEGSHDPWGLIPDRSFAFSSCFVFGVALRWWTFSRLLQLRSVPPHPHPDPDPRFRWKDMVEGLIHCVFCGCVMICYAVFIFFHFFLSLHRSSPPCADPHGLLNLRKVLNALTSGQQWGLWMSWDFEVATSRSDSSELGESRSSWLILPIWTFGLELVKKFSSGFLSSVFFSEAEYLGGTCYLLAHFAYVINTV